MSRWLYQMNGTRWPPAAYRAEMKQAMRTRESVNWPTGKLMRAEESPAPGDIVFLFYLPNRSGFQGICGLGIVTRGPSKAKRISWEPLPPTSALMENPWWDERVEGFFELIRVGSPQGTMWPVPAVLDGELRRGAFTWANAGK